MRDDRELGYIALIICIVWYREISPESALRIACGKSNAKPGRQLTDTDLAEIKRVITSPNHKNMDNIERKYRVNRYDLEAML